MERELRNIFRRFISISGCSLLVLFITGPMLNILNGINNLQIGSVTVCAFAAALSSLMFISKRELSSAEWWVRETVCIMTNVAVALPVTYFAGLWHSLAGMIVMVMIIILIAFGNHLIEFLFDLKTASQLNRKLKEIKGC